MCNFIMIRQKSNETCLLRHLTLMGIPDIRSDIFQIYNSIFTGHKSS